MNKRMKSLVFLLLWCFSIPLWAWNAQGHQIIAQIAVNHLTPHAKIRFDAYNQTLERTHQFRTLVNTAPWLDKIRYGHGRASSRMHYIDLPFTEDGTPLPKVKPINAVFAVHRARRLLLSQQASYPERAAALRILLHVVGDLHQPLHAATRVSRAYPLGDKGGNLVVLPKNSVSKNLHTYWDKGAGLLTQAPQSEAFKKRIDQLERRNPCRLDKVDRDPMHWALESFAIAKKYAYAPQRPEGISLQYQQQARQRVEERLAVAGCRLAAVLNDIDASYRKRKAHVRQG
jgi:hypothetical protein